MIWCGRVRRQCGLCDKPTSNCPAFCCAMAITYNRPAWDADAPTMAGRPALRQHEGAGVRSEHRLVAAGRETTQLVARLNPWGTSRDPVGRFRNLAPGDMRPTRRMTGTAGYPRLAAAHARST